MKCRVAGRVQGVFYRAATRQQALSLGLTGWAHNLADGRVEVLAIGETANLETLRAWLWQGPPQAQVTHVDCEPVEAEVMHGFTTL